MAIPIPNPLVEFILLGPLDDRRQLQDTPILGDVWVAFGKEPSKRIDLLIAPYRGKHAGAVAAAIEQELKLKPKPKNGHANIAFLQGLVVASLTFEEVLRVVLPKTKWWLDKWKKGDGPEAPAALTHDLSQYLTRVEEIVKATLKAAEDWHKQTAVPRGKGLSPIKRFLALAGLILWAAQHKRPKAQVFSAADQISSILKNAEAEKVSELIRNLLGDLTAKVPKDKEELDPLVWQVWLDRAAMPALTKSVPAVKADAAKTLFSVNCKDIAWAVIDSGIDGTHVAFRDAAKTDSSRVKRSFDFRNFRKIVSLSNSRPTIRKDTLKALLEGDNQLKNRPTAAEADAGLKQLAKDALSRGAIHWDLVARFVEIEPNSRPTTYHGTHVAGIIGASKEAAEAATKASGKKPSADFADGMCPDISLYDFRVLGQDLRETEFAIIAALQFIRYLNEQDPELMIHGANLSLSIPHDVRNFACGRTPICDECERLVGSGVVVVAAAGNHGYKSFETKEGAYDSYAAFSITDPGNADCVITVGSTHRFWPHTYGVSFFSSRGPTGDGRVKPDLVAPGERIRAPLPGGTNSGGDWGDLDGTSMAAPHVSGAAAMLMARYSELIGEPRRIKQILCASATDLGRERSFQGSGMLDVLRAFQSI